MEFLTNHIQSSNFNSINLHHVKLFNLFIMIKLAEFWVILNFYDALLHSSLEETLKKAKSQQLYLKDKLGF
jgi:hypothetical protein